MMWHALKVEVLSLNYQPSHRYLDMRQECRTSKSVASHSCDWLLLILAIGAQGASLPKTDGNGRFTLGVKAVLKPNPCSPLVEIWKLAPRPLH